VVLDKGRVAQFGRPLELFHRPANLFVAGFIGSPQMNLLPARVEGQGADSITLALNGATLTVPTAGHCPVDPAKPVTLGIRPDRLELADTGQLTGTVRLAERLGTENHLHVDLATGGSVVAITDGTHPARARDRVQLRIAPADAHVFDAGGIALPRKLDAATEALITEPDGPADPA
jgi:multiple sugar transport system ATP-binding protein